MTLATTLVGWALAGTVRVPFTKDAFGVTVPLIYASSDRRCTAAGDTIGLYC